MVQFVMGTAGSGKSEHLLREAGKAAVKENAKVFVIVPRQFTFETERKYYRRLGARLMHHVTVVGFARLVHLIFKEYGGAAKDYADDSIKLMLMHLALHEMKDELEFYHKTADNLHFAERMLEAVGELKRAGVEPEKIGELSMVADDDTLEQKSRDIAAVFSVYDAMLGERYQDSLDDMARACELVHLHRFFDGCTVFIDELDRFTPGELEMIRLMVSQGAEITVALCTDHVFDRKNSLFDMTNETYTRVKRVCREAGGQIAEPVILHDQPRFHSPELGHLERNILRPGRNIYRGSSGAVRAVLAGNEYEEADYAAACIRDLAEHDGYSFRDIVVVSRNIEQYRSCLETAFAKYDIPFYADMRKSISFAPLIRLIGLSCTCVLNGYRTDDMISLLKCGLSGYSPEQVARLENYAFLWDIRGKQWREPFRYCVFGTQLPETEEEKAQNERELAEYNEMRAYLVSALEQFRRKASDGTIEQTAKALTALLDTLGAPEQINRIIRKCNEKLTDAEALVQGEEYRRVWEIVGELLDVMISTAGSRKIGLKRWQELFLALADNFDMGTIPQTLDSVAFGSAERIRTDAPKVLFVLGANDKIFPYVPENSGIFTDRERTELRNMGIALSKPLKERIREEHYIAYRTLCIPSERLYVTARKTDVAGKEQAPSILFSQLRQMFGQEVCRDTDDMDRLFFCRTPQTAFSELAYRYRQDNAFTASLREYFSHDAQYAAHLEGIEQNLKKGKFRLKDLERARMLYGERVSISPTRVEDYYKCRFLYFCRHGLRLMPRKKVTLLDSNRGIIIHEVLYRVCSQISDFSCFDEERVRELIKDAFDDYLDRSFGGDEAQSKRFLYLYRKIRDSVFRIVKQLFEELSQSRFRPSDFEYTIGAPGNARPLAMQSKNGIDIYLSGKIDRVDVYDAENGQRFIRVIDYKTGTKNFRLADLVNGINLQMFIYLMCLEKNGRAFYEQAEGAGVLYMPASDPPVKLGRDAGRDKVEKNTDDHYRLSGVVLDDEEVIRAMEQDLSGRYTPLKLTGKAYDKNKQWRENIFVEKRANDKMFAKASIGALLTAEQLGKLYETITDSVRDMVDELYSGEIEARPLRGANIDPCAYCDYKQMCRHEEDDEIREYKNLSKDEILSLLETHGKGQRQSGNG